MQSENINELATAMAAVQAEIKAVSRDSTNPFFKSKYAGLEAVLDALFAVLPKNGLSIIQTAQADDHGCYLETLLLHSSGQWISGMQPLKPVKDDPQGMGSAITYARRYGAAAICGLAQEDDDGNDASGNKKPDKKPPEPPKQELTPLQVQEVKFNKASRTREELMLLLTLARPGIAPITAAKDGRVIEFLDKCLMDGRTIADIYLSAVRKLPSEDADTLMDAIEKAGIILPPVPEHNYMEPKNLLTLAQFYAGAKT